MSQLVRLVEEEGWHEAVVMELNRSYSKVLDPFTDNAGTFRAILRATGAVISGSTALWYLLRMPDAWTPRDMDIVTPYDTFNDMFDYLMSLPAAVLIDEQADDYRLLPGYYGRFRVRTSGGYIDIRQSRSNTPFTVITGYWSTHVMNALTADAFWSAYPSLTLQGIGVYNHTPEGGTYTAAVERHRQRGFKISTGPELEHPIAIEVNCDNYVACPRRDRYWGDQFTLKVPLAHRSVQALMESMSGTHTACWRLGTPGCGNSKCLLGSEFRNYCVPWVD